MVSWASLHTSLHTNKWSYIDRHVRNEPTQLQTCLQSGHLSVSDGGGIQRKLLRSEVEMVWLEVGGTPHLQVDRHAI